MGKTIETAERPRFSEYRSPLVVDILCKGLGAEDPVFDFKKGLSHIAPDIPAQFRYEREGAPERGDRDIHAAGDLFRVVKTECETAGLG